MFHRHRTRFRPHAAGIRPRYRAVPAIARAAGILAYLGGRHTVVRQGEVDGETGSSVCHSIA